MTTTSRSNQFFWALGIIFALNLTGHAATISQQIANAVAAGAHQVRIQPGVYRVLPAETKQAHVILRDLRDLEIDASGVMLVCSNLSSALDIKDCLNTTLRGLTIDYDPLPITQGTIVGFAANRTWTDVRIHSGYPAPTLNAESCHEGRGFFLTYEPVARLLKHGTANRCIWNIIPQGNGVYRLDHGELQFRDRAAVGDFIRIPQKYESATGINILGCTNLALIAVTLFTAPPHFGIAARYCHDLTIRGVRVIPGPPPVGATEPRLFSTVGDGINCGDITGKLVVEDCDLDATGDDGIAVYAEAGLVLRAADDKHLTISFGTPGHPKNMPGFRLWFATATNAVEDATVVAAASTNLPRAELEAIRQQAIQKPYPSAFLGLAFNLELDKSIAARAGDMVVPLDEMSQEFLMRSNRINNAASRGIVANRSWGRVEYNRVAHTFLPGIHVFNFFRSEAGSGAQERLRICNNQVEDSCMIWPGLDGWQGAISVVSWEGDARGFGGHRDADSHRDIVIEGNQISKAWGVNIQVQRASGVMIRSNLFCQSNLLKVRNGAPRPVDNSALIFLQNVKDATVTGNEIVAPGPYISISPLTCVDVSDLKAEKPFGR